MITRTNIENDKTDNNIENDNVVIDIENADEVGQRMHLRDPEVAISNSNAAIMFLLQHFTALQIWRNMIRSFGLSEKSKT